MPRKPARKAGKRSKPNPTSDARRETTQSLRGFARFLGVSLAAVQKAIASGRLAASIGRAANGTPYVADPEKAVEEWNSGATKPRPGQAPGSSLVQAQLGVAEQRRDALALANAQKRGELVSAAAAERAAFDCARTVKEAMLNLPDRLASELAGESDPRRVHARLEEEVRLALESLAEVLEHGE